MGHSLLSLDGPPIKIRTAAGMKAGKNAKMFSPPKLVKRQQHSDASETTDDGGSTGSSSSSLGTSSASSSPASACSLPMTPVVKTTPRRFNLNLTNVKTELDSRELEARGEKRETAKVKIRNWSSFALGPVIIAFLYLFASGDTGVSLAADDKALYRRYTSSACVHASSFSDPESQLRLRTALIDFPWDSVVRTLVHELSVNHGYVRGWWRNDVYTSILHERDDTTLWYFTAKGELHDNGIACVALGGVSVRREHIAGGRNQLWLWMERSAWKITDRHFSGIQVQDPWILPIYWFPNSVSHRLHSLDLFPAQLERFLHRLASWTTQRIESHVRGVHHLQTVLSAWLSS